MKKLIIEKGYKEFQINDDENAVIRVNTTDFGLIDRLNGIKKGAQESVARLEKLKESDNTDEILAAIRQADTEIKEKINSVFGYEVSPIVFGEMNCLSFAGGQPVSLNFLDAIIEEIKKDMGAEQKAAEKKIEAYADSVKDFK